MISDKMRAQMYRDHRQRLRYVRCRVNSGSVRLPTHNSANCVNSDSFRSLKNRNMCRSQSNPNFLLGQGHPQYEKRNIQQQVQRQSTKSIIDHRQSIVKSKSLATNEKLNNQRCSPMTYPSIALSKYPILNLPETGIQLQRLLRPVIYMDLELKALRPVGRVLIQLYTEASPQVVLEFMRLARNNSADSLFITRVFPSLWLEGELRLPPDSHTHRKHEFDTRSLNHTNHGGIVSYSRENISGIESDRLSFAISFRPLPAANSKRIAFGRIVGGLKYLYELQDYGTKSGKPTRKIFISKCGLFSKTLPSRRY
ncbi:peptidyl-prolyl cis-trans isomerase A-like 4C [Bactrocera oleae]|uniref:peptidyl-prolyl cis-trans isomerase A-like 4C n=1 Tax=Bactrocera oleae TaxID=104688 RepID=UPI00174A8A63|nr:peptidyl-prolyl cis-trans isomerase E-like [Bactrocera oleae]